MNKVTWDQLSAYVDNELSEQERTLVERALMESEDARAVLAEVREVNAAVRREFEHLWERKPESISIKADVLDRIASLTAPSSTETLPASTQGDAPSGVTGLIHTPPGDDIGIHLPKVANAISGYAPQRIPWYYDPRAWGWPVAAVAASLLCVTLAWPEASRRTIGLASSPPLASFRNRTGEGPGPTELASSSDREFSFEEKESDVREAPNAVTLELQDQPGPSDSGSPESSTTLYAEGGQSNSHVPYAAPRSDKVASEVKNGRGLSEPEASPSAPLAAGAAALQRDQNATSARTHGSEGFAAKEKSSSVDSPLLSEAASNSRPALQDALPGRAPGGLADTSNGSTHDFALKFPDHDQSPDAAVNLGTLESRLVKTDSALRDGVPPKNGPLAVTETLPQEDFTQAPPRDAMASKDEKPLARGYAGDNVGQKASELAIITQQIQDDAAKKLALDATDPQGLQVEASREPKSETNWSETTASETTLSDANLSQGAYSNAHQESEGIEQRLPNAPSNTLLVVVNVNAPDLSQAEADLKNVLGDVGLEIEKPALWEEEESNQVAGKEIASEGKVKQDRFAESDALRAYDGNRKLQSEELDRAKQQAVESLSEAANYIVVANVDQVQRTLDAMRNRGEVYGDVSYSVTEMPLTTQQGALAYAPAPSLSPNGQSPQDMEEQNGRRFARAAANGDPMPPDEATAETLAGGGGGLAPDNHFGGGQAILRDAPAPAQATDKQSQGRYLQETLTPMREDADGGGGFSPLAQRGGGLGGANSNADMWAFGYQQQAPQNSAYRTEQRLLVREEPALKQLEKEYFGNRQNFFRYNRMANEARGRIDGLTDERRMQPLSQAAKPEFGAVPQPSEQSPVWEAQAPAVAVFQLFPQRPYSNIEAKKVLAKETQETGKPVDAAAAVPAGPADENSEDPVILKSRGLQEPKR